MVGRLEVEVVGRQAEVVAVSPEEEEVLAEEEVAGGGELNYYLLSQTVSMLFRDL